MFGSCRVGAPAAAAVHASPRTSIREGVEIDALWAYSRRLQAGREPWPDCLLLLGDQVYADEVSPETLRLHPQPPRHVAAARRRRSPTSRSTRGSTASRGAIPDIRWLLSTVPSTMIFDDHDVHDDWNISERLGAGDARDSRGGRSASSARSWRTGSTSTSATSRRPSSPRTDLFAELPGRRGRRPAAAPRSRSVADRESAASRWAYHRDFGRSRLVVVDSRAARVLADGRRDMVDEDEWDWIVEHARGAYDHLILASTLPVFMAQGIHHLEAWNEAVCAGAWGGSRRALGERMRRARRPRALAGVPALVRAPWSSCWASSPRRRRASRRRRSPCIGGDVHTAYVAEVALGRRPTQPRPPGRLLAVPQPAPPARAARDPTGAHARRGARPCAALARAAGVAPVRPSTGACAGPTFDNSIAVLELDERAARVTISRSGPEDEDGPR